MYKLILNSHTIDHSDMTAVAASYMELPQSALLRERKPAYLLLVPDTFQAVHPYQLFYMCWKLNPTIDLKYIRYRS